MIQYTLTGRLFLLSFFAAFSFSNLVAQDIQSDRTKTVYAFTVGEVEDLNQIELLAEEIQKMDFVEKVKINYKEEKSSVGQLLIYVNEPIRTKEDQVLFDPTVLKKSINAANLTQIDLSINKY